MLLTTSISLASSTKNSTPTIKCSSVISACQNALAEKDAAISAREAELGQYAKLTKKQVDELESDKAWYKSPYLYLFLGLAAGVYVGKH